MNRSKNRLPGKLRQKAGETLTETLVALFIGTMGLALMASMIGSGTRLIRESKAELDAYYAGCSHLVTQDSDGADGSVTIRFEDDAGGHYFNLTGTGKSSDVTVYTYGTYNGTTVTTFKGGPTE